MADRNVLSYHDSLLKESDLKLLECGMWLNDKIIGFAYEYFTNEQFRDFSSSVVFVSPDVSQFIKLAQGDEIKLFLEPLDLVTKELIFLPVNDNSSADSTGGCHWSLLIYRRNNNSFIHLDSAHGGNSRDAKMISRKLLPCIGVNIGDVSFIEEPCPQQQNGYDCGVYVICFSEDMCRKYLQDNKSDTIDKITPEYVSNKRNVLKALIQKLTASQS